MVISNSDSNNTLISLNSGRKTVSKGCDDRLSIKKTHIYLPFDYQAGDDDSDSSEVSHEFYLHLPDTLLKPIDKYLALNPHVMEIADAFLLGGVSILNAGTKERIIYVLQNEVAHATSKQCDILVSDRATTCHILALRSSSKNGILGSLTHIDSVGHEACLRAIINEHHLYHHTCDSKKRCCRPQRVNIDIYLVGGFDDRKETSSSISNFLITLLAQISEEKKPWIALTLKLCAVSSINDDGYGNPICRGMGLSLETGHAFMASVDCTIMGPALNLRSARLWWQDPNKSLHIIHSHKSNKLRISPFQYRPPRYVNVLLSLPDQILLQQTSTSPDVEESDFCSSIRSTLYFMKKVKWEYIFGKSGNMSLEFRRHRSTNHWMLVQNDRILLENKWNLL
jgi:Protein N-terminal asparagine amidohydrolase